MAERSLAQRETGLDLSRYSPEQYNILSPVLRMDTAAPFLRLRAVEVRLDPDPDRGDCYPAPGAKWQRDASGKLRPTLLAPAKPGLLKIASAAGLVVDPRNSRRIKPEACERCIEMAGATGQAVRCGDCPSRYDTAYQYIGAIRSDAGWRVLKATYEWSLDSQRRKIEREARKRAETAERKGEPFDVQAHIEDRLDQVIAERHGLAETKALLRLVRAICHLRQTYTPAEMARPFVVARAELAPDYADPEVRRTLAERALTAGAEIFGGGESAPPARLPAQRIEPHVIEQLAGEPDFSAAPEEAPPIANGDLPAAEPEPPVDENPFEDAPPADEPPAEEPPAESGGLPLADEHQVLCDRCGRPVPDNVVAYCQSERGRAVFEGRNYCFRCQDEIRGRSPRRGGGAR